MQIMGNQQDPAIQLVADIVNQLVEGDFTIKIDSLNRLIQHQKVRRAQDRTGKQDALELAAGQFAHLRAGKVLCLGGGKGGVDL